MLFHAAEASSGSGPALPRDPPPAGRPGPAPPATLPRRARVLAVDDSPTFLAAVRHELATEPYRLVTVRSAATALALLERHRFDCVLVDLVMPEIDGVAFCERLGARARAGGPRPMVLVLTGLAAEGLLPRALAAGAEDFLVKEADGELLRARVRLLLRRRAGELERRRMAARLRTAQREALVAEQDVLAAGARAGLLEELQRNHRSLDQLACVAAHDLKAPLRTLASLGQILLRRESVRGDAVLGCALADIVGLARRMAETLEALVELVRLPVECAPGARADLGEVLERAAEEARAELGLAREPVDVECPAPAVARGEPALLARAFAILLAEALRPAAGAPSRIRVSATRKGSSWRIRFRRADGGLDLPGGSRGPTAPTPTGRPDPEGHDAMRLETCRKIVETAGGRILRGRGPAVTVILPDAGVVPDGRAA